MNSASPIFEGRPLKRSWTDLIISQLVGWLFCIGLPVLVTTVVPVSWVKFQREGDQVTARAEVCLLFFIPFRTMTVHPVTSVGNRTVAGSARTERRSGPNDRQTVSERQGFLTIQGPGQNIEVPATPHDLESNIDKAKAFLKDPQAMELKLFTPANWKFGVIGGGLASMLLVLYVGSVAVALGLRLVKLLGFGKRLPTGDNPAVLPP